MARMVNAAPGPDDVDQGAEDESEREMEQADTANGERPPPAEDP